MFDTINIRQLMLLVIKAIAIAITKIKIIIYFIAIILLFINIILDKKFRAPSSPLREAINKK